MSADPPEEQLYIRLWGRFLRVLRTKLLFSWCLLMAGESFLAAVKVWMHEIP